MIRLLKRFLAVAMAVHLASPRPNTRAILAQLGETFFAGVFPLFR